MKLARLAFSLTLLICFFAALNPAPLFAQRIDDHDLQQRIKNLLNDTKHFRSSFDNAIGKSIIRKTSQAKDARNLASTFEDQVQSLLDLFKQSKKAQPYLQNCQDTSIQIDKVLSDNQINGVTYSQWQRVKTELNDIAQAFNAPAN